jgi:hypothetical protein
MHKKRESLLSLPEEALFDTLINMFLSIIEKYEISNDMKKMIEEQNIAKYMNVKTQLTTFSRSSHIRILLPLTTTL